VRRGGNNCCGAVVCLPVMICAGGHIRPTRDRSHSAVVESLIRKYNEGAVQVDLTKTRITAAETKAADELYVM
jgi:hypothetical protein